MKSRMIALGQLGSLSGALQVTENAGYLVRPDPFRPEGMQFERTEWIQRCITEMWRYLQEWTVPELRRGWGHKLFTQQALRP